VTGQRTLVQKSARWCGLALRPAREKDLHPNMQPECLIDLKIYTQYGANLEDKVIMINNYQEFHAGYRGGLSKFCVS